MLTIVKAAIRRHAIIQACSKTPRRACPMTILVLAGAGAAMAGFDQADILYARGKLAEVATMYPALFKMGYGSVDDPGGIPLTAADPAEFLRAVEFLKCVEPIPTPDRNRTSTGYTHIAERWWRRRHCDDPRADNRISNGVFIAAAIALGFPIRRIHDNYNVQVGISSRSLRNLDR
jgi:hypothetical protein